MTRAIEPPGLIEVYPHPALLELSGAPTRLTYKAAKVRSYWPSTIPTVETWMTFAASLRQIGLCMLATSDLKETGDGKTELRIAGLLLLSRTLSNLKATLLIST